MSELAIELIEKAKQHQQKHLDLGNCGLRELPNQLFDLTWLESLSLGFASWQLKLHAKRFHWVESLCQNTGAFNKEIYLSEDFKALTNLKIFQCNGKWGRRNRMNIHNTDCLRYLTKLRTLSMGNAHFTSIDCCTSLSNLHTLILFGTNTKNLQPLQALKNLNYLILASTNVEDISPLSNLDNIECLNLQNTKVKDLSVIKKITDKIDTYVHADIINSTQSYGVHISGK